jgi:hypothetical protein
MSWLRRVAKFAGDNWRVAYAAFEEWQRRRAERKG